MDYRDESTILAESDSPIDGVKAQLRGLRPRGCRGGPPEFMAGDAPPDVPLRNWPLQIQLVPPNAPYLFGAKLVLAADCSPFARPDFHERFLQDRRVVLVACPKLGDAWFQRTKLAQILSPNQIKEVHVVHVDVPCCSGFVRIVRQAMRDAGCRVPLRITRIATDGSATERTDSQPYGKAGPLLMAKERTAGAARNDGLRRVAVARTG